MEEVDRIFPTEQVARDNISKINKDPERSLFIIDVGRNPPGILLITEQTHDL